MRRLLLLLFIIGMSIFFANAVYAQQSVTTSLNVNANAVAACSVTTSPVNFGDYTGELLQAQGNIEVTCTDELDYTICLNAGQNFAGENIRRMTDGQGNYITYQLMYGITQWGDAPCDNTISLVAVNGSGSGSAQNYLVDGAALAGPTVPAGSYSDIVTVTVMY